MLVSSLASNFFTRSVQSSKFEGDRVDRSSKLTPYTLAVVPKSFDKRIVGVSNYDKADEDTVLQTLNSSGKCHDWAANAVYYLSIDKFMSHSLVMYLRWTTWGTLVAAIFFYYVLRVDFPTVGKAMEASLLCVGCFDSLNLREDQMTKSSTRIKSLKSPLRTTFRSFLKVLLTLFISWYCGIKLREYLTRCTQYCVYVLLTFLFGLIVHYILEDCETGAVGNVAGSIDTEVDSSKKIKSK